MSLKDYFRSGLSLLGILVLTLLVPIFPVALVWVIASPVGFWATFAMIVFSAFIYGIIAVLIFFALMIVLSD
jgi:hypothetical protein